MPLHQGNIFITLLAIITIFVVVPLVSPVLTNLISYSTAKSELLADFKCDANVYFSKNEITVNLIVCKLVGIDKYYIKPNSVRIIAPNGEYVYIKPAKYVPSYSSQNGMGLVGYTLDEMIEVGRYTSINIYIPYQGDSEELRGRWIVEVDIYDVDGDLVTTMVVEAIMY